MRDVIQRVAITVATAAGSGLLTWIWIQFARARRIEDMPGKRRLHHGVTPRGGGIAIALVLVAAFAWIASPGGPPRQLLGLAMGIGLFAAVGLLDDLVPTPALPKFALQLLASAALVLATTMHSAVPVALAALLVIACAYAVNVWNFMDGSNGLVGLQALVIGAAVAAWPGQSESLQLAGLSMAGASMGFLPFNFPRAHVFLGDVGSHVLGAAAFGLLLLCWLYGSMGWQQALLVSTVLLMDSGLTLARRLLAGKRVWLAHREHLYQFAVRRGVAHARIAIVYAAITVVFSLVAALSASARSSFVMPAALIIGWALAFVAYMAFRKQLLLRHPRRKDSNG